MAAGCDRMRERLSNGGAGDVRETTGGVGQRLLIRIGKRLRIKVVRNRNERKESS